MTNRINEQEMAEVVKGILRSRPGQKATFAELRDLVPKRVRLSKGDRAKSPTRPGEELWMQIVRNLKAHNHEGFMDATGGLRLRRSNAHAPRVRRSRSTSMFAHAQAA